MSALEERFEIIKAWGASTYGGSLIRAATGQKQTLTRG